MLWRQVGRRGPAGSPRRRTWPGGGRPGRPSCRPRPRTRPGPRMALASAAGRPVEDPGADQRLQRAARPGGATPPRRPPPPPRRRPRPPSESRTRRSVPVGPQPGRPLGQDQVGPEQPGLLQGPVGQLAAADPAREAQVVADHGRRSRPARRPPAARPPGCPGPRRRRRRPRPARPARPRRSPGRRTRRPGVVPNPERGGQLGVGGVDEDLAAVEQHHRQAAAVLAGLLQQAPARRPSRPGTSRGGCRSGSGCRAARGSGSPSAGRRSGWPRRRGPATSPSRPGPG